MKPIKRVALIFAGVLISVSVWSFAEERKPSRVPVGASHYFLQLKVLSPSSDKGLLSELKSFEEKANFLVPRKDGDTYVLRDGATRENTSKVAELRSNRSLSEWRAVDGNLEVVFFPGSGLEKGAFVARSGKTEPLVGTYTLQGGW